MSQKMTRRQSLTVLSIIELLERFSYYGMRSIAVIYLINEAHFNIPREDAFTYYGYTTSLIIFFAIPIGLLSDFVLKQEKAVQIGSILAVIGYGLLLIPSKVLFAIGILFIIIGSSAFGINTKVLLGRLYQKEDQQRNAGFIAFFFALNIGALLSALIVGYFAENVGFQTGFLITLITMISASALFYYFRPFFNYEELKETANTGDNSLVFESDSVLDDTFINEPQSVPVESDHPLKWKPILLTMTLMSIFWIFYEGLMDYFFVENTEGIELFGMTLSQGIASSLFTGFPLVLGGVLIIISQVRKLGGTLYKFGGSFLILSLVSLLIYLFSSIEPNSSFLLLAALLFGFAEIGITAFAYSYLTRLSNIKYASTVMGTAILFIYLLPKIVNGLTILLGFELHFTNIIFIAGGIGLLIVVFKKKIQELAGGLD